VDSILPLYPSPALLTPSRTTTASSTSSELPLPDFNRRSANIFAKCTSDCHPEALDIKHTTGGMSSDVFASLVPQDLPPCDLSTDAIYQAMNCARSVRLHPPETSRGKLPMDRFLEGRNDPGPQSAIGELPMSTPTFTFPAEVNLSLRPRIIPGALLPHGPAAHSFTDAQQSNSISQRLLPARRQAESRILSRAASLPRENITPNSKIVQAANGKEPSANLNSGTKTGANAKKAVGQTSSGKAANNSAFQGGGGGGGGGSGGASNGGNDAPKKSKGKSRKSADAKDKVKLPCVLNIFETKMDIRCMNERAENARDMW
jgi:hypothetical protein